MQITEERIRNVLKQVKYPGFSRDIVSFGVLKQIIIHNNSEVGIILGLNTQDPKIAPQVKADVESAIRTIPEITRAVVDMQVQSPAQAAPHTINQARIDGVKKVIAVASGKGGVGKSTVAVNLACALQRLGAKVGLMDCDIYGPSVPLMMGTKERPTLANDETLEPVLSHGVKLMSMGFLLEGDDPVIWRGPMIMKTVQQFIRNVAWAPLDYLLVDMPPGTGDAQLSLCQTIPLDGCVMVTTPQEASLGVVRRGTAMFQKLNVPILGIVENMSSFVVPGSTQRHEIFGSGGGQKEAERISAPFLGEVPIYTEIRVGGDKGVPIVVADPNSDPAKAFLKIAEGMRSQVK
jgi:ATP-binding protein involved in chromosome partitioning